MKRAQQIALITVACAVAFIAASRVGLRKREPAYEGRSLSQWIHGVWRQSEIGRVEEERVKAIRAIGTNGLPYLVKWMSEGTLPPQSKFDKMVGRINSMYRDVWFRFKYRKAFRASDAVTALAILGPVAHSAMPALRKLGQTTNLCVNLNSCLARASLGDPTIKWYGYTANHGFNPASGGTVGPSAVAESAAKKNQSTQ